MKRYVLLLGGTGARIADALLAAASAGVFPAETLSVLLADTDRRGVRSASLVAAKMADYACIRQAATLAAPSPGGPFQVQLNFSAWPQALPGGADTLSHWTQEGTDDALLCQALFDQDAAGMDLHEGFHGRRMLGQVTFAGLLHEADQDPNDPLSCLVDDMAAAIAAGEEVRVVLAGSICGGTGAAGFPALCRYIRARTADQARLGAILLGANTDQQDAATAYESLRSYARDGLCDTIGLLALPASSRTGAPADYPQLTDWLAVYMMDVLLHRPDWLTGLFTVRAPEGAADWRIFGQSANRYRIAYGRLMKAALAWQHVLSSKIERRLEHPFFLRDGLFGWYAHFFRRMQASREDELELLRAIDRLTSVCLLWLGGVSKTLPIDLRSASLLSQNRREAAKHYQDLTTLASQMAIMDDDAQRTDLYADDLVYRSRNSQDAEEAELAMRRIEAVKQEVARAENEQAAHQRKMGGAAAMSMLEDALAAASAERDELRARHEEAVRRIDHAEAIAPEEEQYRITDARTKLQRLERRQRMLESRTAYIQADVDKARAEGLRFDKPALAPSPAENELFLPDVADKLLQRDSLTHQQVESCWSRMVCPEETVSLRAAMKDVRRAPADRRAPLMSLFLALMDAAMLPPAAGKEAKR